MSNIKGISDVNGNISITTLTNTKYDLLRTDLDKLEKDNDSCIKTNANFDVYIHLYKDDKMKTPVGL